MRQTQLESPQGPTDLQLLEKQSLEGELDLKEIISTVIFVVGIYRGTPALRAIHDNIRKASLETAAQGLLSLVEISKSLRNKERLIELMKRWFHRYLAFPCTTLGNTPDRANVRSEPI